MPAPRTCRNCDAALPPDVRWCGLCYEPVREFTSRAPLNERIPEPERTRRIRLGSPAAGRTGGRYSRWERTPTTFGPVGRSVLTVLLVGWMVSAFFTMFVVFWLILASVGGWILREVWKPGWVPVERIVESVTPMPVRSERHPEPVTAPAPTWVPLRTKVAWVGLGGVVLGASFGFAYGNETVQAIVLMGASLTLLVGWFAFVSRS
jgi:hypothetical protein